MGQGRSQSGRRVRAVARSLAIMAALGVFSAAAAYAHGGLPKAGPLKASLPNNHLQYAVTWYGLAAVILIAGGFFWRSRRRAAAA